MQCHIVQDACWNLAILCEVTTFILKERKWHQG